MATGSGGARPTYLLFRSKLAIVEAVPPSGFLECEGPFLTAIADDSPQDKPQRAARQPPCSQQLHPGVVDSARPLPHLAPAHADVIEVQDSIQLELQLAVRPGFQMTGDFHEAPAPAHVEEPDG